MGPLIVAINERLGGYLLGGIHSSVRSTYGIEYKKRDIGLIKGRGRGEMIRGGERKGEGKGRVRERQTEREMNESVGTYLPRSRVM